MMIVYALCWAIPIGMFKLSAMILASVFADLMMPYGYSKDMIVATVVGIHNTIYIFWVIIMVMWSFKLVDIWAKKDFHL